MSKISYFKQTTQDAVRHQPTTTAKKQKKATFVATGSFFLFFKLYIIYKVS
ncbi:hypothetical protein [Priestia megaterium]|uniref:hypothetical protein n=1 Tax=Priestia megaterium TaxID=1404 RepID=UPI002FFF2925